MSRYYHGGPYQGGEGLHLGQLDFIDHSRNAQSVDQLRDKVKTVQEQLSTTRRAVRTKDVQLQKLRHERLPSDEIKREQEQLKMVQDKVLIQENRLRKLKESRANIKQQHLINSDLTAELEGLRVMLENKQREIVHTDQIIAQINNKLLQAKLQQHEEMNRGGEITSRILNLKNEMNLHRKLASDVQTQFISKRGEVRRKREETSKVDAKISELWSKLQAAKQSQPPVITKSATVIAAVGPYDSKPQAKVECPTAMKPEPSDSEIGSEIDIKLVERHGGSGQSSPSISADEREPFRPAKPPSLNNHKSAFNRPAVAQAVIATPPVGQASSPRTESVSEPLVERRAEPTTVVRHQRTEAIGEPSKFEPPPPPPVSQSVKLEPGPKIQPPSHPTHLSISSVGKPKNFNRTPQPFGSRTPEGVEPTRPSLDVTQREPSQRPEPVRTPVDTKSSPTKEESQITNVKSPDLVSPSDPIRNNEVVSNNSTISAQSLADLAPGKVTSPRYASRSQISNTYIPPVDKNRLEQYKRDMEQAVRFVASPAAAPSLNPQPVGSAAEPAGGNTKIVIAGGTDLNSNVTIRNDATAMDTMLTVKQATDVIPLNINTREPITSSSEDEKPSAKIVVIESAESPVKATTSILRPSNKKKSSGVSTSDAAGKARFHPLVILLDTALNGSLEEVQEILPKVDNPSASNDEGITALHNAICAGHLDIVKCLVEHGVDVNATDTDGWTPLHCAASCNNAAMVEYLASRGAAVLARTYSDRETARDKCEQDEEGFAPTIQLLEGFEAELGCAASPCLFSVYNCSAENEDELSVKDGDELEVIRRGDEEEEYWWWAKNSRGQEGYVATNLLAFTQRAKPRPGMDNSK